MIHKAREHNLKNIDVEIPRDRFTVITGVSGSGKSTLAFDILFNEGQRRYLESLNAYARQFVQPAARPDVDAIFGIPPTVAIEQRTSRGGRKSTVATLTEIYHFLRLLYVKLGTQYCPDCDVAIEPQSAAVDRRAAAARLPRPAHHAARAAGRRAQGLLHRPGQVGRARRASARCASMASVLPTAPWPRLSRFREHTIELPVAEVDVGVKTEDALRAGARARARLRQGAGARAAGAGAARVTVFSTRARLPLLRHGASPSSIRGCSRSTPGTAGARAATAPASRWPGFDARAERRGAVVERVVRARRRRACGACQGQRLNPTALNVRFRERSIAALAARAGERQRRSSSRGCDSGRASSEIARDLLAEIRARLKFLERVGLGYLQLDRAAPTLSGGEAQRIRLAAQLGSNLQGVCYVLDEPTIGLHPRDNADPARLARRARRASQHAGGRRARRRHHPPRRSRAGSRARRRACAAASWWARARCRI